MTDSRWMVLLEPAAKHDPFSEPPPGDVTRRCSKNGRKRGTIKTALRWETTPSHLENVDQFLEH